MSVRRKSVIGAAKANSNGESIPKNKWQSICAVKFRWAWSAKGPATESAANKIPQAQQTLR
ncbi:hypothetical protein J40TS1_06100 [Paenibacillus montaniterrae]|uniref:Uncharacterized protein n=1 Tax=Paenibacillus montaniterrae TaxID=429341 RepID=A0A919YJC9_9BACL|nr:hypothetical protein J40TS1_06100 [Paenibacillus montaniterrae]